MKILARKLNVPVVCLGQVQKDIEINESNLFRIRGYGSIEQVADVILFVNRNCHREKCIHRGKILVAKNHNGNLGSVDVDFYASICSFVENQRVFTDVLLLDDIGIQKLLRRIEYQDLAKSLKGTESEFLDNFFHILSTEECDILKKEMNVLGTFFLDDVLICQRKIAQELRVLEDFGEVIFPTKIPSGIKVIN